MNRRLVVGISLFWTLACSGESTEVATGSGEPATPVTSAPAPDAPIAAVPEGPLPDFYQITPYSTDELKSMSLTELQLRRNTIFARAGQPFRKKWLDTYFRYQEWYHPLTTVADDTKLTAMDRQNAAAIAAVESGLTREELRERKTKLIAGEAPESWHLEMDDAYQREIALLSAALGEWEGDPSVPMSERSPMADPNVLDTALTEAQLADLSRRDLRIVRNTIFARHGRAFKSELLQEYFAQKVWYTVDPAYVDTSLTDVDKANIATIVKVEESLGGMMTEKQQAAFETEYMGGA